MKVPILIYHDDNTLYFTNPFQLGFNVVGEYNTCEKDTLEQFKEHGIFEIIGMCLHPDKDFSQLTAQEFESIKEDARQAVEVTFFEVK